MSVRARSKARRGQAGAPGPSSPASVLFLLELQRRADPHLKRGHPERGPPGRRGAGANFADIRTVQGALGYASGSVSLEEEGGCLGEVSHAPETC